MPEEYESKRYSVEVIRDPATNRIVGERWYNEAGQLDRLGDLPAYVDYNPEDGLPFYERWHKDNALHRDGDKPATVVTDQRTRVVVGEHYALRGETHRDGDLPAVITRTSTGKILELEYFKRGKKHRELGAAFQKFSSRTGKLTRQEFWQEDSRSSGPTGESLDMSEP